MESLWYVTIISILITSLGYGEFLDLSKMAFMPLGSSVMFVNLYDSALGWWKQYGVFGRWLREGGGDQQHPLASHSC